MAVAARSFSQARIISSSFSGFNVSAENMCNINLTSNAGESTAYVEARITNAQGANIIKVTSQSFALKNGVFNTSQLGLHVAGTQYQSSAIAEYIRLYHQLPSGRYSYCISLRMSDGSSDELCEDIESENSSFLSLVNPPDKDTLVNEHPVLIWNHTESFNILQQGEFYRMVVAEIKEGQSADAAINVNNPVYQANFLTRHDVLYPFDAPRLQSGQRYGWQVQKIVNGVITNKTEAWEFVMKNKKSPHAQNFVELKPGVNTTPYIVGDDKLYFIFREDYFSEATQLNISIIDSKGNGTQTAVTNIANSKVTLLSKSGSGRYEVDLRGMGLKQGYYTMKIMNEKNQVFLLNFLYND